MDLPSIAAAGVALVDAGGGGPDDVYKRAAPFQRLGYRVAVLRDDDKKPTPATEESFTSRGGINFTWADGQALEDELFCCLSDDAIAKMLDFATDLHGDDLVDQHIRTASSGSLSLEKIRAIMDKEDLAPEDRAILGKAARMRRNGWFKQLRWMEDLARNIMGDETQDRDPDFRAYIDEIFAWAAR